MWMAHMMSGFRCRSRAWRPITSHWCAAPLAFGNPFSLEEQAKDYLESFGCDADGNRQIAIQVTLN